MLTWPRIVLPVLCALWSTQASRAEYIEPARITLEKNIGLAHVNELTEAINEEYIQSVLKQFPFVQRNDDNGFSSFYHALSSGSNVFAEDIDKLGFEEDSAADNHTISSCLNDTATFVLEALGGNQQWASRMLDAQAKIPSGILDGNRFLLGSYEECLSVTSNASQPGVSLFNGRYCSAQIPLTPNATPDQGIIFLATGFIVGVCVPDSCTTSDVSGIINTVVSLANINTTIFVNCPDELDVSEDGRAIAAITICSIIGFFVLLGTAYDVCMFQVPKSLRRCAVRDDDGKAKIDPLGEKTPLLVNDHANHHGNKHHAAVDQDTADSEPGTCGKALLAFSLYSNGAKILKTAHAPGSITCLHGIRFLSMSWVILGHAYVFVTLLSDNVGSYAPKLYKRWTFQAVLNGTFSVDTFFFLSGLLVAYLTFREMKKKDGKINWALFYFHRFWRLTPTYMLLLMIDICLFRYFGDGPLWPQQGVELNYCEDTWWRNLLYINNFFSFSKGCMSWTWYLANDMQFFVISPLVLIPLYRSKRVGVAVLLTLLTGSFITTGAISSTYGLAPSANTPNADVTKSNPYQDLYYQRPYCRIGPYLVGIAVGYILYSRHGTLRMNRKLVFIGWIAAFTCNLAVLYGLYGEFNTGPLSTGVSALYNTVSRTAWAMGLAWLVIACSSGYGGFINTFLSLGPFVPLGRLTYCAYLIHPLVLLYNVTSGSTVMHATDSTMVNSFLATMVISYGLSFVASLSLEAPWLGLEKILLPRGKPEKK